MTVKLHYTRSGSGPPVVLLHGLFGSANNLGALARALQGNYCVYCVDLPNHGRSDWLDNTSLITMMDSIEHWQRSQQLTEAAFVGHSLGGKVAMQLALAHPQCVSALVVADIAPVDYPPHHDQVFAALEAVASDSCRSRHSAAELMATHIEEEQVIQFLLSSLRRDKDGVYRWRFNLEELYGAYAELRASPVATSPYTGPVLFIKGGASDYIREEHRARVVSLFPRADVKIMPGCGHWFHAERPQLFNSLVMRFLDKQMA